MKFKENNSFFLSVLLACFFLFLAGLYFGLEKNKEDALTTLNRSSIPSGTYVRLVFIGSSSCFYSNNPDTHRMVRVIKSELESMLIEESIHFISTGLSFDHSDTKAINYLQETGSYDELLVGEGAFNLGMIHYASGSSATPMLLLFVENYDAEPIGLNYSNFTDSQRLLRSYTGQYEIEEFYNLINNRPDIDVMQFLGIKE